MARYKFKVFADSFVSTEIKPITRAYNAYCLGYRYVINIPVYRYPEYQELCNYLMGTVGAGHHWKECNFKRGYKRIFIKSDDIVALLLLKYS